MKKVLKYVMIAMLLGLTSLANSASFIGRIDIVNGGQGFYWPNTANMMRYGFIKPVVLAANESFIGIQAHSTRLCFKSSTTRGLYNPGKLNIIVPGTADNDKELSYEGVILNKVTKKERVISLLIDNWNEIPATSLPWNIAANKSIVYGGALAKYSQPLVTYANGNVTLRFNADVLSGFIYNNVPTCNMSKDNIHSIVLVYKTGEKNIGVLTKGIDNHYYIVFGGIKKGASFNVKMIMYNGGNKTLELWFDDSFWAPGTGIIFNGGGTMTTQ